MIQLQVRMLLRKQTAAKDAVTSGAAPISGRSPPRRPCATAARR